MVFAVFFRNIFNDFVAAVVGKVQVDIGRAGAFWVHEPFKGNVVLDRVDGSDPERISHQGTGDAAAAWANADLALFGPVNKILDNQKVGGKAFIANGF